MAEHTARTHPRNSNRARSRKVAFKSVFDNPFRLQWRDNFYSSLQSINSITNRPSVHPNMQNAILERVVSLLDGVSEYRQQKCTKRTRTERSQGNPGSGTRNEECMESLDTSEYTRPSAVARTSLSDDQVCMREPH